MKEFKIAIIGSGIGGSACAFFLQELLKEYSTQETIEIDIIEAESRVGGRMKTVTLSNGYSYECGASVIHSENKYLVDFKNHFGLTKQIKSNVCTAVAGEGTLENGPLSYFFHPSLSFLYLNSIVNSVRYIYSCGLRDFLKLCLDTRQLLKKFSKIYELQQFKGSRAPTTFDTTESLLKALNLYDLTQITFGEYATKHLKLGPNIISNLIVPAVRVNYCQGLDIPALPGMITVAASLNAFLWCVKSGNECFAKCICDELTLEDNKSKSQVKTSILAGNAKFQVKLHLNTNVSSVRFDGHKSKYEVTWTSRNQTPEILGNGTDTHRFYDYVVVAMPIYDRQSGKSNILKSAKTNSANAEILQNNDWILDFENSERSYKIPISTHLGKQHLASLRYHPLWVYFAREDRVHLNENTFGRIRVKNPLSAFLPWCRNSFEVEAIITSWKREFQNFGNPIVQSFNCISLVRPIKDSSSNANSRSKKDSSVWKIFANDEIEPKSFLKILSPKHEEFGSGEVPSVDEVLVKWNAYPEYNTLWDQVQQDSDSDTFIKTLTKTLNLENPTIAFKEANAVRGNFTFPPLVLHKNTTSNDGTGGVYHLNSIEWAGCALEMSAISAKNCALLICRDMKIL